MDLPRLEQVPFFPFRVILEMDNTELLESTISLERTSMLMDCPKIVMAESSTASTGCSGVSCVCGCGRNMVYPHSTASVGTTKHDMIVDTTKAMYSYFAVDYLLYHRLSADLCLHRCHTK